MPVITTNTLNVTGRLANMTLYTNSLDATTGYSNIVVSDNLKVDGSVFTQGRMDVGNTIYATFRLQSNLSFGFSNETHATSNLFVMDWLSTDMHGMEDVNLSVPTSNIFNSQTGEITVPAAGLYLLEMQGLFQNSGNVANPQNGVYYYFKNLPYSSARMAANFTTGSLVSTSHSAFLLAGDKFVPTFYSTDPESSLLPTNGETYVRFVLAATVTPTHSNYIRFPTFV